MGSKLTRGIALLGSTGSIGRNTLDVVRQNRDTMRVVSLAAGTNLELLFAQVREFRPDVISVATEADAQRVREWTSAEGMTVEVGYGVEGHSIAATANDVDLLVSAMSGTHGLLPTFRALQKGARVALANKEILVSCGELFMAEAKRRGTDALIPVDSEHSAIFQCLYRDPAESVESVILTASGGPFRTWPKERFSSITIADALNHPTWRMGRKITIDSATMMNKGLEVIEARWLFDLKPSQIRIVVHPQSIVHSMVRFVDGSILAQLGPSDMRFPIEFALRFPDRRASTLPMLDPVELPTLTFEAPDFERFPSLVLAYRALELGGLAPLVLNVANEVAVEAFLSGQIGWERIPRLVEGALDAWGNGKALTNVDEAAAAHEEIRHRVLNQLES